MEGYYGYLPGTDHWLRVNAWARPPVRVPFLSIVIIAWFLLNSQPLFAAIALITRVGVARTRRFK
jgi:hypothetical protein